MPKVLEERVAALIKKGYKKKSAWAIATDALQKEGKLGPGSQKLKSNSKTAKIRNRKAVRKKKV